PRGTAPLRAGRGTGSEGPGANPRGSARGLAPRRALRRGRAVDVRAARRLDGALGAGRPGRGLCDRRRGGAPGRRVAVRRADVEPLPADIPARADPGDRVRAVVPSVRCCPRPWTRSAWWSVGTA